MISKISELAGASDCAMILAPPFDEIRLAELSWNDVDRHRYVEAGAAQARHGRAALLYDPVAHAQDQAGFLGDGDEDRR